MTKTVDFFASVRNLCWELWILTAEIKVKQYLDYT